MPHLSIKDVPEPWAEALRQRALRNHRSLQGELMAILEQAVQSTSPASVQNRPEESRPRGHRTIEETAREQRLVFPDPVRGGPFAVDLIRTDRDSR